MDKYPIITHMLQTLFNVEDGLSEDVAIRIYQRAAFTSENLEGLKLELLSAFSDTAFLGARCCSMTNS